MKLTLGQAANSTGSMQRLVGSRFKADFAYRLSRIFGGINQELKHFEAARNALIERLDSDDKAINDKANGPVANWRLVPEKLKAFNDEYEELAAREITIWGRPVAFEDLKAQFVPSPEVSELSLMPADFLALEWFFVPPADEAEEAPPQPEAQPETPAVEAATGAVN